MWSHKASCIEESTAKYEGKTSMKQVVVVENIKKKCYCENTPRCERFFLAHFKKKLLLCVLYRVIHCVSEKILKVTNESFQHMF